MVMMMMHGKYKLMIKGAQHRLTVLHIHYYSQDSSKIFFLPSHIVYILCFVLFGHVPSLFESHRCAHAQAATAIPTAIFARWPFANRALHGAHSPMSTTHNPLPIAYSPLPIAHSLARRNARSD